MAEHKAKAPFLLAISLLKKRRRGRRDEAGRRE
jgi:hypothetical protein